MLGNSDISALSPTVTGAINAVNSKTVQLNNASTSFGVAATNDGTWVSYSIGTSGGSKWALLAGKEKSGLDLCDATTWTAIKRYPDTDSVNSTIDTKIAGKQDNIPIKIRNDLIIQWNGQIHQQLTYIYGRMISIHVELISPVGGIAPWTSLFCIPRPLSTYSVYLGCWFLSDGTARGSYYTADPYSLISNNGWVVPEGYNYFTATYVTADQV